MDRYKIISADSHFQEPDELYDGLPPEYRHRAPRIEERNGGVYLIKDGVTPKRLDIAASKVADEDKIKEFRGDKGLKGGFSIEGDEDRRGGGVDIPMRLADQELDGVSAEVIYPQHFDLFASPSAGYQFALARLYNDYGAEIFGEFPDRLVPSAVIPMPEIGPAVEEVNRVSEMGYRSISIPISMPSLPYNRPEYEPVWTAIANHGIPLSFHILTRGENMIPEDKGEQDDYGSDMIYMALGMVEATSPLTMLVASGVLQRHPSLKFVLVECGIGWLAWFLYAMDELAHKRHMWQSPQLDILPSEYFKRQGYITFGDDPVGLHNVEFTGVDGLLWGSDYPHDEGTFPHSREVIERTFKELSEEDKRKIVGENAARVYGFPLN